MKSSTQIISASFSRQRDSYISKLNSKKINVLQRYLRHLSGTSLLWPFCQQREGRKVSQAIENMITFKKLECRYYQQNSELPRVPTTNLPQIAAPNLAVTHDVMRHTFHSTSVDFLVFADTGDWLLRLSCLPDATAQTSLHAFLGRGISNFYVPASTMVDCDSNLSNACMWDQLRLLESWLCSIKAESSWSSGRIERFQTFLHKAFDKSLFILYFNVTLPMNCSWPE